ncbi:hypothetical protein [Mesorhizobium sp. KR1-2]|uniref:hypothetical protein n=1 Tax=Mesorhizobium sp. KR1-2 TaxID=3156609 RepID=UPI0032B4D3FA
MPMALLWATVPISEQQKRQVDEVKFAVVLNRPIKASPLLNAFMAIFAGAALHIDNTDHADDFSVAETASKLVIDKQALDKLRVVVGGEEVDLIDSLLEEGPLPVERLVASYQVGDAY